MTPFSTQRRRLAAITVAAMLLAACGGGHGDHDDDDDHHIDTAGRLVITEQNATTVRVYDLDSAAVEASYSLENEASQLYASPQWRYAVAVQRTQDQVQFIDGGIYQEDHGEHLHDYKKASKAVSWKLTGSRPTHYDVQAGVQAAFFMDGNDKATPVENAGVRLFSDSAIKSGQILASLDLDFPIHGLGEPVGNKLLVTSRAEDAGDALPTHLNLYHRIGSGYTYDRQIPMRCNGMHGSFSSGDHTVTGCLDGMLLVRHTGIATVDDGTKLEIPIRVGTIAGHFRLPNRFIGIGNEGVSPALTARFFAVDATATPATVSQITIQDWASGTIRRAHAFDRTGQRFYVLDNTGTLTMLERDGAQWKTAARISGAIPAMPTAAPWPAIVANGAKDLIYITDPVARQLIVINALTGTVEARRDLGYAPALATWTGIYRQ